MYRLKLANIPNRPGVELFPSLEVGPAMPRTEAFLAHNAIPVEFSDEDFDQVMSGNFVTKVIYLPDPEFQEMALAGVGTLVSTRLDPGVDPIVEADRRGAIMAIVRLGNKDLGIASATPEQMGFQPGMQGPCPTPGYVAGMTAPQYGMPISGTPIGLAGPPYVPLECPPVCSGTRSSTIRLSRCRSRSRTSGSTCGRSRDSVSRSVQPRPHRGTYRAKYPQSGFGSLPDRRWCAGRAPCPTDGVPVAGGVPAGGAAPGGGVPVATGPTGTNR